VCLSAIDLEA